MAGPAPDAELSPDLAALVRQAGSALVAAVPLSRRGAKPRATAFQLRFADGTLWKGTELDNPDQAAAVAGLASDLPAGAPRVISQRGAALVSEWVEGVTLQSAAWTDDVVRACGALQAQVHMWRPTAPADADSILRGWHRRLSWRLDVLVADGLLAAADAGALAGLARDHMPARCDAGVVLGDFCAENIVCRDGAPYLIDLETLIIGPCDYDLGRTWYRWPMSEAQRAVYLDGYRRHRSADAFLAHRVFWTIAALAEGAVFRAQQRAATSAVPLDALRALLAAGGADPPGSPR
ncbi:MAG: phosphotransferase family protein [Candidatus Binatia bacterium]